MTEPHAPLTLRGADNFRSLIGLPSADGRRLSGHTLLRSGRLDRLDDEDWSTLRRIGLRTVCDLRGSEERRRHPNRYPERDSPSELWLEVRNDLRSNPMYLRMFTDDPSAAGAHRVMQQIYRSFPRAFADQLPQLIDALDTAGDDGHGAPLLLHCAAGKDRTGFVVALLLHALGMPDAIVTQDYLRSEPPVPHPRAAQMAREFEHLAGFPIDPAALQPLLGVHQDFLTAAFDALIADYGSIPEYLQRHGLLDRERQQRLCDRYLD